MKTRNSILIKGLRSIQSMSILLMPIEYVLRKFSKTQKSVNIVAILAPPRSGSTLLYQILSTGIESLYLSNISNFFYATPLLGNLITKLFYKNKTSEFQSTLGFVPGLKGEAEGLKYWKYWVGQDLLEKTDLHVNSKKVNRLRNALLKMNMGNKPIFWGYLGHVFCFEQLHNVFKKDIVFIHLKRDMLSNIYSLYKASQGAIVSTQPLAVQNNHIRDDSDLQETIVQQVKSIYERIAMKKNSINYIDVNYEELCDDPHGFLDRMKEELAKYGVQVNLRKERIPKKFNYKLISADLNEQTLSLYNLINSKTS